MIACSTREILSYEPCHHGATNAMSDGSNVKGSFDDVSTREVKDRWERELVLLRIARFAAAITAALGTLVLVGWAFNVESFMGLLPGLIVMLPNTAIGFVVSAICLWLLADVRCAFAKTRLSKNEKTFDHTHFSLPHLATSVGATIVLLLGLLTFIERMSGADFGIDLLFFADRVRTYPYLPPGRMATNSTVSFMLAGMALLLASRRSPTERPDGPGIPSQMLATAGFSIAAIALVGYFYGARPLYAIDAAAGMALITALSFATLHLGILFLRPSRAALGVITASSETARLIRGLLATNVVGCLTLGWLWLRGRELSLFGREGGVALFVVLVIALLVPVTLRSAQSLRRAEEERANALREALTARALAEGAQRSEHEARTLAEQASRSKNDFLATMSHELRTPLNAIIGYTSLLLEGVPEAVTVNQHQQLQRVDRSARHLLVLIDEVLSLASFDDSRLRLHPKSIEVHDVLQDAAAIIVPLAREKELALEVHADPALGSIETDPDRLRQIIVNLLSNAVKFTAHGRVALRARSVGDQVEIVVEDTGIGIDPKYHRKVFDAFWQVNQGETRTHSGTGLGLAIVARLTRMLGGTITIRSSLGAGTAFTLALPRTWGGGASTDGALNIQPEDHLEVYSHESHGPRALHSEID